MLAVHCWPRRTPDDDTVAVYDDHDAGRSPMTASSGGDMENMVGRHACLECEQPDAMAVMGAPLDELVAALEHAHDVVIVVSAAGVTRSVGQGGVGGTERLCLSAGEPRDEPTNLSDS